MQSPAQVKKKEEARKMAMLDLALSSVEKIKVKPMKTARNERKQTANNPEGYETAGYAI